MTEPTYDPGWRIPPPRPPRTPWWKSRPMAFVYLVALLSFQTWWTLQLVGR